MKPISMKPALRLFVSTEAVGGLALMAAAAAALVAANTGLAPLYTELQNQTLASHTLTHWVNDALMVLFFLLVGLEIKRELLEGQLATWRQRLLPGVCALGGMVVPALVYMTFNLASPATMRGWAIPSATDIAFALGVLALFGSRVPTSLKIFLTALAILDDIGAIVLIALFYTAQLHLVYLGLAAVLLAAMFTFNRYGVKALWPYLGTGALLWVCVAHSGLHATLAGVLVAFAIPLKGQQKGPQKGKRRAESPLLKLEHALQPYVALAIVPLFGFFNAGVGLQGLGAGAFGHPVTAGVFWGLFAGKQLGIGAAYLLATRVLKAPAPQGASGLQTYAVLVLCGVGFTMSLFIGNLAFAAENLVETRVGILAGSLASVLLASAVLFVKKGPVP